MMPLLENDMRRSLPAALTLGLFCILASGVLVLFGSAAGGAHQDADALRLQLARELVDQTRPPIGAVLAYWGATGDIEKMKNWELCDGKAVRTEGSPLFGMQRPDLNQKFIRGVTGTQDLRAEPVTGGSATIEAQPLGSTGATTLKVRHLPAHSHPHRHYVARSAARVSTDLTGGNTVGTEGGKGKDSKYVLVGVGGDASAGQSSQGGTNVGKGEAHSHSLPSVPEHDNIPPYVGLFYIIRVK